MAIMLALQVSHRGSTPRNSTIMVKQIKIAIILLVGVIIGSAIEHSIKKLEYVNVERVDTLFIEKVDTLYLTKQNVYAELKRQEVPHAEIVLAQSLLETGNYKSKLAHSHSNIFGMRTSKGYKKYKNWSECISDYKKRISSRLKGGENYYQFLVRIGYAEDPSYTNKLKQWI